ncbi:MAG: lysine--tRNA ligase, partial [Euryarchaeota archaeon]|nr:lysine--tRNA ligase [Euryarchaeota archaeon]
ELQRKALESLAHEIQAGMNAEDWHNLIYNVASATKMETKELFQAIYMVLLKKPSGPRAGWLLASLDSEFLRSRFESATEITD